MQESILWHQFNVVYWMIRDLNLCTTSHPCVEFVTNYTELPLCNTKVKIIVEYYLKLLMYNNHCYHKRINKFFYGSFHHSKFTLDILVWQLPGGICKPCFLTQLCDLVQVLIWSSFHVLLNPKNKNYCLSYQDRLKHNCITDRDKFGASYIITSNNIFF